MVYPNMFHDDYHAQLLDCGYQLNLYQSCGIAKNHQFLGVNSAIESLQNKEGKKGKLGVFWHTQGSGKSYSMILFTRKIQRKITGNWSFLIVTDRKDLDAQIYRNFNALSI